MSVKHTDCEALNTELVEKTIARMHTKKLYNDTADFFKVMGDCTRLRLLWALDGDEMCVCDLAVVLNMTKSAVSHQLKTLKNAKLVKSRKSGKNVYYSLDDEHVRAVFETAVEHLEHRSSDFGR